MSTATVVDEASAQSMVTALRFYKRGDLRLEELEPQLCGPDEVRVKVAYSGICGTDVTEYIGGPIFPPQEGHMNPHTGVSLPIVMGHEFSGIVCEIGSNVEHLNVGQPVVISPAYDHRHHGSQFCGPCKDERYNICDASATIGLNAPGGGFCDQTVVKDMNCIALPSNVSLKAAALVEPLAIGRHCITSSGFKKGQSVLICGAGPIGLAIVLLLRVMGASKIIVTEVLESRMMQARKFGADVVLNPLQASADNSMSAEEAIEKAVPGGVDIAFDAIGFQSTLDLSIASVKPGGVIFNVAIHKKPLSLNLNDLAMKEKKLTGGISYFQEDFDVVIGMLAEGKLEAEQMITSIIPLSEVVKGGFEELVHNREAHIKILIKP
ncbi:chaperonin 10-like protein [Aspergillus pseudotamarii]|uniref:Chaperonin 10-like protein n=1 Tax=Aspergillus pseudotamarii TaxID=132259 RepID=A0A5N6TBY5_ASPPS|nr:chaperonin 10-like protein [Aspergillus pseudotamarii]KAE8143816.1 chaperonin 10-like protein [Aspergillus pseudotamarii]